MFFWAAMVLIAAGTICFYSLIARLRLQGLEQVPCCPERIVTQFPLISVIIPACNEEQHIGPTLDSLLGQEYPHLEIIAINDRSIDGTGTVIEDFSRRYKRVTALTIETLPEGWLGKNHALHLGAAMARGEFLLFTDADIRFAPTTLCRAMSWVQAKKLDHLTLLFRNTTPGNLLNAVIVEAMTGLLLLLRPWRVADPKSKYFIGIGAFNLVSRKAYRAAGGHERNPLHPIDDIVLGKVLKQAGFHQGCLRGERFVSVAWYADLREMIAGLMKNVYAFYNYSVWQSIAGALIIIVFSILPLWGVVLLDGPPRWLCMGSVLLRAAAFRVNARSMQVPGSSMIFFWLAPYFLLYISLRATVTTLYHQGIWWRGTLYPLSALREVEPIVTVGWLFRWR